MKYIINDSNNLKYLLIDGVAVCRYENNGAFCWFTKVDDDQIGGRAVGRNPVGRHSLGTIILTETQLADII